MRKLTRRGVYRAKASPVSDYSPSRICAEAIDWRIRLRDGEAGDWDEFQIWLEHDPSRAGVYDTVALEDNTLDAILVAWTPPRAKLLNDNQPLPAPARAVAYWLAAGGALAAAAGAALIDMTG